MSGRQRPPLPPASTPVLLAPLCWRRWHLCPAFGWMATFGAGGYTRGPAGCRCCAGGLAVDPRTLWRSRDGAGPGPVTMTKNRPAARRVFQDAND